MFFNLIHGFTFTCSLYVIQIYESFSEYIYLKCLLYLLPILVKKSGEDFVHSAFQHLNIGLLTNIHLLIYMFQLFFASLL